MVGQALDLLCGANAAGPASLTRTTFASPASRLHFFLLSKLHLMPGPLVAITPSRAWSLANAGLVSAATMQERKELISWTRFRWSRVTRRGILGTPRYGRHCAHAAQSLIDERTSSHLNTGRSVHDAGRVRCFRVYCTSASVGAERRASREKEKTSDA